MKSFINARAVLCTAVAGAGMIGNARAQTVVDADVSTSTTWTLAGSPYNLKKQIYVTNMATLTIEAGVVVATSPEGDPCGGVPAPCPEFGGSLAVTRGSMIMVNGTAQKPVIFTSAADVATWVGGDPKTGTWREAAAEWGNLTICGQAYVSENVIAGNTAAPNANNYGLMEGLTEAFPGDLRVRYGGGLDEDDSGTLSYVSLRYGGKVVALNNELNGLSLGGIGRNTDIHHVEVMNNVDDGIEIWGGTVNLKYVSIWNIGDDSLDIDQGWRGKSQFGLIVKGYSRNAAAGSGVGDKEFEVDGAEQSDYQPVTTANLYNFTVIGQPLAVARNTIGYRDGARIQLHNSIIMNSGGQVVRIDNVDGDGGLGYGINGTLSWADTWTTAFNSAPGHANDAAPGLAGWIGYTAQSSGRLNEITDTVFWSNQNASAYTEANARGVFDAGNDNVNAGNLVVDQPIQSITRAATVNYGGTLLQRVTNLDPRPANAAIASVGAAPADGFFSSASYRGAFAPSSGPTWLASWTASYAYGFTPEPGSTFTNYCPGDGTGTACPCGNSSAVGAMEGCLSSLNTGGQLRASGFSSLAADSVVLTGAQMPNSSALYFQGTTQSGGGLGAVFGDGLRCAAGAVLRLGTKINTAGTSQYPAGSDLPVSIRGNIAAPGTRNYQCWYRNAAAFCSPSTFNLTNGVEVIWTP